MALQRLTPDALFKPAAYTQVVVASGRRIVFVSGQVSMDAGGRLVAPGDFAGQARQVYDNLRAALEGAGVAPADVAKLTTYVVGYKPELRSSLAAARATILETPSRRRRPWLESRRSRSQATYSKLRPSR